MTTTHARDQHTTTTGTTTGTCTITATQRATIVALIDDADADLLSTLLLLQSHASSGGSGVAITPSGRVVTIGHIMRARLMLVDVQSQFTTPALRNPQVNSPDGFPGDN